MIYHFNQGIGRRGLFRGVALVGSGAIGAEILAACSSPHGGDSTPSAAASPTTVTTPANMPEQWLPANGDFLSSEKLQAMTPEQLAVAGQIKVASVKTLGDLGNEIGYRINAMTGAGRTLEDLRPFMAADGQINESNTEAYIEAVQAKYLLPLTQSISLWNSSNRQVYTTTGLAQGNRFELSSYAMNRDLEALGAQPYPDGVTSFDSIEGSFVEGDLNSVTAKVNMKFRKRANNSQTPIGNKQGQKDIDQYETYLMIVSKSDDHILTQFTGPDAVVQPVS
jgi:hypothetical protein